MYSVNFNETITLGLTISHKFTTAHSTWVLLVVCVAARQELQCDYILTTRADPVVI